MTEKDQSVNNEEFAEKEDNTAKDSNTDEQIEKTASEDDVQNDSSAVDDKEKEIQQLKEEVNEQEEKYLRL